MNLAEPFIAFYKACEANKNRIPYAVYYADEIFESMDGDEFNCVEFVKQTRVESKLLAKAAKITSVNNRLQDWCTEINTRVVGALKSDDLDDAMHAMRDYNEVMSSKAGHNEFKKIFGKIF